MDKEKIIQIDVQAGTMYVLTTWGRILKKIDSKFETKWQEVPAPLLKEYE